RRARRHRQGGGLACLRRLRLRGRHHALHRWWDAALSGVPGERLMASREAASFLQSRRLDPLLLNSPLRRPRVALAVAAVLALVVAVVALTFLGFFGALRPDIAEVFFAALAGATAMSIVPLAILWFLDRRERETPWLFAAAFL